MTVTLPLDLLRLRLKNEVETCRRELPHHLSLSDYTFSSFPVQIDVTFMRVPGPSWENGRIVHRYAHGMSVLVSEEYPAETPVVKWRTPIFHPNIMPPEDGGYVCTKLLENWDFNSTLYAFIRGVEWLLTNPNPRNPFGSDTCTRAAAYFNRVGYNPPLPSETDRRRIRIIGEVDDRS